MLAFNYRSFRNHLEGPLEKSEIRFLMRTFGFASIYFVLFGVFVFLFHYLVTEVFGIGYSYAVASVMGAIGFILCFPLHYFAIKYRNNPLRVPSPFVNVCFVVLTFSFLFVFLGLTGIVHNICGAGNSAEALWFVGGSIAAVIVSSALIYAIPVIFAWFIQSKKKVMKLNKFLNTCYLIYLFVFVANALAICLGFRISGVWQVICLLLLTAIIFCGPVLTIYRLKTVAYYINHDDGYERRRWENYFTFEIAFQLLHIAFFVLKVLILLIGRTRTRLR